MSEPDESDHLDGAGEVGGADRASAAESGASGARHNDAEMSDLSDTGVGLSAAEPNTFEPEEAGPAADGQGQ